MKEHSLITVKEIVVQYLESNGYDGLFLPGECACKIDGLMPCEGYCGDCEPGVLLEGDDIHDFYVARKEEDKNCPTNPSNSTESGRK